MSRLRASLRHDARLQARSQLYTLGLGAAIVLGVLVRATVPGEHLGRALPVVFMLGIGGTTYMFGASMVLFDRAQGTLDALRVSPLLAREYLLAKMVTLTAFALVESAVIYLVAGGAGRVDPLPLVAGATVLGASLTALGLGQVASHPSVTSFLVPDGLVTSLVAQLPVAHALGLGPSWLWYLVPTQAPFRLMLGAVDPLEGPDAAYVAAMSLALLGGSTMYAIRRSRTRLGLRHR